MQEQLALIARELASVSELYRKGLERLPRMLALERNQAALKGQIGRLTGQIAQLEKQIGDAGCGSRRSSVTCRAKSRRRWMRCSSRFRRWPSSAPSSRLPSGGWTFAAPRSGNVIDLKVHTIGHVIGRGEAVMQIVPQGEDLVVIAKVSPRDIDSLNSGVTKVQVRMTAFSQRFTHPVEAHLESISADVINPGDGTNPYYRAIIRLDPKSREHLLHGVELTSGMPAMAMIGVGEKTLLSYLFEAAHAQHFGIPARAMTDAAAGSDAIRPESEDTVPLEALRLSARRGADRVSSRADVVPQWLRRADPADRERPGGAFSDTVPTEQLNRDFVPLNSDLYVIPEPWDHWIAHLRRFPARKYVFCQNHFYLFHGLSRWRSYEEAGIDTVFCCSEVISHFLTTYMKQARARSSQMRIDHALFRPRRSAAKSPACHER